MTPPVFLRRAAELDVAATEDWYDSQRPGLGGEFGEAVDHAISWLFWHAFTEGVIPERFVLDSAGASNERLAKNENGSDKGRQYGSAC